MKPETFRTNKEVLLQLGVEALQRPRPSDHHLIKGSSQDLQREGVEGDSTERATTA